MSGEFDLIARIRARAQALARADVLLGIGDDAAIVRVPADHDLIVSTDTLNEGVHFPRATAAFDIGWKALAVNLSDLAAMAAQPAWCTLNLTLPQADAEWLDAFLDGFFVLASQHGVSLIGGDTTRGPLAITVTAHGFAPHGTALRRDGARAGDDVWVSGTLGDAAAGLATLPLLREGQQAPPLLREVQQTPSPLRAGRQTPPHLREGRQTASLSSPSPLAGEGVGRGGEVSADGTPDDLPSPGAPRHPLPAGEGQQTPSPLRAGQQTPPHLREGQQTQSLSSPSPLAGEGLGRGGESADTLRARLNRPTPRVELGLALRGIAHAGIDISDGLLADLGHILAASSVGAELDLAALPTSPALQGTFDEPTRQRFQLGGGDDYELCFTAPPSRADDVRAAAVRAGVAVTCVGRIDAEHGLRLRGHDGESRAAPALGYRHFEAVLEGDPGDDGKAVP